MKIVLLEDEIIVVRDLKSRLRAMGYTEVEAFDNGFEFLDHIAHHDVDLVLIDININGSINGIETVEKLPADKRFPVIYLTAQGDKPTFDAAKATNPAAYLLKPYNAFELQMAIELAIENYSGNATGEQEKGEEDEPLSPITDKIFVKHNNKYESVMLADILYMEAFGNYTEIHTADKKYVVVSQLGKIEAALQDPMLIRCHRSFIVNLDKIDGFDDAYLFLGDKSVPFSKGNKAKVMERLRIL